MQVKNVLVLALQFGWERGQTRNESRKIPLLSGVGMQR